jgi:tripartite-type tricarboxylate transporter receptor subunit TctC
MEQGEVHGNCVNDWGSLLATSMDDLRSGKQRVILQMITNKKQSAPQGDAPTAYEFAKSDEDRLLIRTGIENPGIYARVYAAPPGTPPDRAQALSRAFDAAMRDPELLAEAQRANLEINPATGAQLERLVQEATQIPDALRTRLRRFILGS